MVRIALAAAGALVALTSLAAAQGGPGKMPAASPVPEERPLYDERKYRAASERVPDAKVSNDPWAGARDVTPPPAATTPPPATKQRRQP
jgi:hypothetical protein